MRNKYTDNVLENYVGTKIHFLEILSFTERDEKAHRYFVCKCDCGKTLSIRVDQIISGNQKSCGCYKYNLKTGLSHSRLYPVWKAIKSRCYNTKSHKYKTYGARGIKVCDEWKDDFIAFMNWSIQNGYDETAKYGDCTIDRIDNNGDYSPSNCRWASYSRQQRNTSNTIYFEYKGVKKPLIDWCEELNLPYNTIRARYARLGLVERVLTQPIKKLNIKKKF